MSLKLSNLNLDALIHFHYVANLRSLSKAAKHLGLSAPAITHSLKKLEAALGVILCKRGKAGFQLTEHGRLLFEKTRDIVTAVDSFLVSLDRPEDFSGVLNIGMIDNLDSKVAQDAIDATVAAFPKIKLNILITDADEITAGIASGEIDVGFGLFHHKQDRFSYVPIGTSTMRYFISEKHPLWSKKKITKDDLSGQRVAWIESKKRNAVDLATNIFVPHPRYRMRVAAYSNHLDGALAILNSGFSVVPIPPSYVYKLANRRHIRELKLSTKSPVFVEEAIYDHSRVQTPSVAYMISRLIKKKSN